jgi:hypothetical protein
MPVMLEELQEVSSATLRLDVQARVRVKTRTRSNDHQTLTGGKAGHHDQRCPLRFACERVKDDSSVWLCEQQQSNPMQQHLDDILATAKGIKHLVSFIAARQQELMTSPRNSPPHPIPLSLLFTTRTPHACTDITLPTHYET